jgi:uncharacterized membrane protein SpoIIM required for sporulation
MELAEFVDLKRPKWDSLERLLDQAETKGLGHLSLEDARSLSRLYRSASSDLLWVRSRAGSADVSGYLNALVGRAYALTYPGKRPRIADVWRFLSRDFPDMFRREIRMMLASVLLFWAGFGFGWIGMVFDPDAAPYLVPGQHQKMDPTERAEQEAKASGASGQDQTAFASFLWTHNIEVSILCFAAGITAGVGTAILLFSNGVLLGALAWVYARKGLLTWFWAWILPHGIPEITAICLSGAAGFVLARGLVAPKGTSRRRALRREAITAVQLFLGCLALFVLAGSIEGTISQIHPPKLSYAFKLTFADVTGAAVWAYLLSAYFRPEGISGRSWALASLVFFFAPLLVACLVATATGGEIASWMPAGVGLGLAGAIGVFLRPVEQRASAGS